MKRIIAAILISAFTVTSAFATDSAADADSSLDETGWSVFGDGTTASATTAKIGRLSTGVGLAFSTSTSSYALITQHKNGVRKFGSASDSTLINWSPATKETKIDKPTAANVSAISGAGWSAM
ncbi:MAG: hypothetical protein FIA89_02200 [Geobacter sp.]|nr:hypothetical protein [Geobacter sp.]